MNVKGDTHLNPVLPNTQINSVNHVTGFNLQNSSGIVSGNGRNPIGGNNANLSDDINKPTLKISMEDVKDELEYWKLAVVC